MSLSVSLPNYWFWKKNQSYYDSSHIGVVSERKEKTNNPVRLNNEDSLSQRV